MPDQVARLKVSQVVGHNDRRRMHRSLDHFIVAFVRQVGTPREMRLASLAPLSSPDLATVAKKAPRAVVYIISALAFHELTTQIPHEIWIAVPRNSEPPRLP